MCATRLLADARCRSARPADFSKSRAARPLAGPATAWVDAKRAELRDIMWRSAGIVRHTAQLQAALDAIAAMYVEVKHVARGYGVNTPLVELLNLVTNAELIVSCALQRKESRGLHYNADHPQLDERECRPSLISTALKARYDLSALSAAATPVKINNPGGSMVLGPEATEVAGPVAGNSTVPAPKAAKRPKGARDLSVRSTKLNQA